MAFIQYIANIVQLPPLSNSKIFSSPQMGTLYPLALTPQSSLQPLTTMNLFPIFMDLPVLDMSYQQSQCVSAFFHIASAFFHIASCFQGSPMLYNRTPFFFWPSPIPFYGEHTLFIHPPGDGHWVAFPFRLL